MIVTKLKSRLKSLSPKKEAKKLTMDPRGRHHRHHRHHRQSDQSDQHRYRNRVDLVKQLVLPETETETETSDSSFQSSSSFAKEDVDRKSPPAKKNQNMLVPIIEAKKTTTSIRGILSSNKTTVFTAAAKKTVQFETGEDLVKVFVEKDKEDNDDDDDDEHDSDSDNEESDASASADLWYSSGEYRTFRSRESKIMKEMSKSFDDGAFSVDGVESLQYKRERRRRMNKSRFDVLLLQESFWEEMERMERLDQTGRQKQQSPCDDKYNQKRRDVLLARTYVKASMASVVLALQRADWNAKQVRDDNVNNK